jgi:dUTP pyrophosphatase
MLKIGGDYMKIICKGHKPEYSTEKSAGLDLKSNEDVLLHPGQSYKFDSKINIELPAGTVGLLVARSGLSIKHNIKLSNDIGVIDEDYRGEIGIVLVNEGKKYYRVSNGDRIAQLLIVPYIQPALEFVDELSETSRGNGGFGHTGK